MKRQAANLLFLFVLLCTVVVFGGYSGMIHVSSANTQALEAESMSNDNSKGQDFRLMLPILMKVSDLVEPPIASPTSISMPTNTPTPTNTSIPTNTPTPAGTPTNTPTPSHTTYTVIASGNWSDPAVWQNGSLPTHGAGIVIPTGLILTVDSVIPQAFKHIMIDGTLRFATDVNTELRVDTMMSSQNALLEIGTASNPIAANVTARIVFADFGPIDRNEDPEQLSRGAVLHGQTEIYGAEKTSWTTLATHPRAGDTTLALGSSPVGWRVGDELVVAATDPNDPTSDEVVRIAAINGSSVTLETALQRDHVAFASDLDVHVANLTRNIEFYSENPTIAHRGHVMFMHTLNVDVNYARFYQLGRTDKSIPLDDYTWPKLDDAPPIALEGNNIRGRYSVHFHRGGVDPMTTPARVRGSVVEDDPGWAYVNHSSNVDFISNVSYRVVGGAYQTEAGDEIGSFINNIALHTINPSYPLLSQSPQAIVDIREDRQDFAFQGDGFWIHGGHPRIEGNVVSGASGHAYIYWTEGLIEANLGAMRVLPSSLPNGHLLSDPNKVDVWWIPVSSFLNNTAYASSKGLEIYYLHATFLGSGNNAITEAYLDQLHSTFDGLTLWGMRMKAIGFNYSENVTIRNARIVGNGDTNMVAIDADHFHLLEDYRFENVTIEGFGVGIDIPTQGNIVIEGGTFRNLVDFRLKNPQIAPRNLEFKNITFGEATAFNANDRVNFKMDPSFTFIGETPEGLETKVLPKSPVFFLQPDRITLNFAPYNGQGLYYNEQTAEFIPMTAENASADDVQVPAQYVGLTNQQLNEQFSLSFGGAILPGDAASATGITGGQVGTAALPATVLPPEPKEDQP